MVTVGISHYCEKTRWALDLSGLPYYEDAHPPGLSALQTTTLDPNVSATPIVRMTNGTVVKDSTTINKIVCPQLYPDDKDKAQEVTSYEEHLDGVLGPTARVFAYHHLLDPAYSSLTADLATRETSVVESAVFKLMVRSGFIQPGMRKFMNVTAAAAAASEPAILDVYDDAARRLASSPYLCGDRFTAADLSFAALSSPLLDLEEFGDLQPPMEGGAFPPEVVDLKRRLRAHPAGEHAARCYRDYRFGSVGAGGEGILKGKAGGRVMIKSFKRDKWGALAVVIAAPVLGMLSLL